MVIFLYTGLHVTTPLKRKNLDEFGLNNAMKSVKWLSATYLTVRNILYINTINILIFNGFEISDFAS